MPTLLAAGQQVHYVYRRGSSISRTPVVFVHGAGGSHQLWLNQVQALPHCERFALDLPGHGQSEAPGRDRVSDYAALLVAFLDAAGLSRAILVGHSMGGAIALEVALRHPGRVVALGLVATGARLRVSPAILDGIRQNPQTAVELMCQSAYSPGASAEMLRQGQRQLISVPAEVLYGDFVACDLFDIRDRLLEIRLPTLVLCGTEDQATPPKFSIYLRDHIKGAWLGLLEGGGHMLMIERPQAVTQALSAFLEGLQPGSSSAALGSAPFT